MGLAGSLAVHLPNRCLACGNTDDLEDELASQRESRENTDI